MPMEQSMASALPAASAALHRSVTHVTEARFWRNRASKRCELVNHSPRRGVSRDWEQNIAVARAR